MRPPFTIHATATPPAGLPADAVAALPAAPAVALIECADRRPVMVAATGDLRAFAAARLGALPADHASSPRTDLRPVAAALRAATVGSAFEADLLALELAREHLPSVYRAWTDRARAWLVCLDPAADPPAWRKLHSLEVAASTPAATLLGPLPDKDTAGRFGQALDDAFDLCRFPRELARAPAGQLCAYHEMHRCPGPCAGLEPIPAFRARVAAALAAVNTDRAAERDRLDADMRAAASQHHFERAAALKSRIESLAALDRPRFRHAGPIDRLALLLVLPSERAGHARLLLFAAGELAPLADVRDDAARDAWPDLAPHVAAAAADPFPLTPRALERLGVVCSHWLRPVPRGRRRRAAVIDLRTPPTDRAVLAAIRAAAQPAPADEPADIADHELSA